MEIFLIFHCYYLLLASSPNILKLFNWHVTYYVDLLLWILDFRSETKRFVGGSPCFKIPKITLPSSQSGSTTSLKRVCFRFLVANERCRKHYKPLEIPVDGVEQQHVWMVKTTMSHRFWKHTQTLLSSLCRSPCRRLQSRQSTGNLYISWSSCFIHGKMYGFPYGCPFNQPNDSQELVRAC